MKNFISHANFLRKLLEDVLQLTEGHKPRKKHTRFTENRKYRKEPKRNPR